MTRVGIFWVGRIWGGEGIHHGEFDGWEYQEELDLQKKLKLILQKYF